MIFPSKTKIIEVSWQCFIERQQTQNLFLDHQNDERQGNYRSISNWIMYARSISDGKLNKIFLGHTLLTLIRELAHLL